MLIEVLSDAAHPGGPRGTLRWKGHVVDCVLGRAGIRRDKREGDGATPAGRLAMRAVLYRPDRVRRPRTRLPVHPIAVGDGWCDAAGDRNYNRPVRHPYTASAERMWRDDGLYDLVVVLDYNLAPRRRGRGSAIFLHVARPGYAPTEGCVALARSDLERLIAAAGPGSALDIRA